jgi:hypothetical protein
MCAACFAPITEQALISHLPCGFASTFSHRKSAYSSDAIPRLSQRIERLAQSESQRAHDARSYHGDPGSDTFSVRNSRFSHFLGKKIDARFPIAFLKEALY